MAIGGSAPGKNPPIAIGGLSGLQLLPLTRSCRTQGTHVPRSPRREPRPAVTLVELLVAVAVVAAMLGLLLPAVQKVRAAAARTRCANNLKQHGLALHGHHAAHARFPRGGHASPAVPQPATPARPAVTAKLGWAAAALPWLEQDGLFRRIDPGLPYTHAGNLDAGATVLVAFVCPANPAPDPRRASADLPGSSAHRYARTDYGAVNGERGLRGPAAANSPERGVLILEKPLSLADVTDGTSQTLLAGEAPAGIHGAWLSVRNVFDQSAPVAARGSDPGSAYPSCRLPGPFCDFGQELSSFHAGGANAVLADGAVRFLPAALDPLTLAALCSRAAGDTAGDF